MKRQIVFLLTFLYGLSFSALGQGSAQATMKASVEVVSGNSVKAVQPNKVNIDQSKADLGQVTLNKTNKGNSLISLSEKVTLTNKKGNEVYMDLGDLQGVKHRSKIRMEGSISSEDIPEGTYQGDVVTTVQYL